MKFLSLVVLCRGVLAVPLSYASAVESVTPTSINVPLIAISISLFFLVVAFLVIKLVYMQHRRMGTIHATFSTPSNLGKPGGYRGLLVGCLGSPTWETKLSSKLDGVWRCERRQRHSFAYQLQTGSTRSKSKTSGASSRLTTSTRFVSYTSHADYLVLPLSSTPHDGSNASKACLSAQRHANTSNDARLRYGDFGELHGLRSPGVSNATRRASPSSIRLVDGLNQSNHVEYAFLAALPPNAILRSPLVGTRDSFQLTQCSTKYHRRPASPLPSLPSFLPFRLPRGVEEPCCRSLQVCEYLPPLRFSPLAGAAKVSSGRVPGVYARIPSASLSDIHGASDAGLPMSPTVAQRSETLPTRNANTKSRYQRSQSCKGLAIKSMLPGNPLVTEDVAALHAEDKDGAELTRTGVVPRSGSGTSKRPLKSCLRQRAVVTPVHTPSMLEISMQTNGTRQSVGDQGSIRTPISDDDIGILGLDRFHWNDEIKELKHTRKDSIALVPLWE